MPRWVVFAALTLLVLAVLLLSTRASTRLLDELTARPASAADPSDGADDLDAIDDSTPPAPDVSKNALFANVAVSQGLFAGVLLAGIVLTGVPLAWIGIGDGTLSGREAIVAGVGIGLVIAMANLFVGGIADAFDADPSGPLRELLTPDSSRGWIVLLLVVLPIVAGFEELLFRGILIGAFALGFELSPWTLAVGSSVAFAAGHGAQGWLGIVLTGVLGFVLAAVFIATGSLLVVVVAHYVVNAAEFALVEGVGYEPFGG